MKKMKKSELAKVKALLKSLGPIREIANKLNITPQAVRFWFSSGHGIPIWHLDKLIKSYPEKLTKKALRPDLFTD